jgi:hypothetical protein
VPSISTSSSASRPPARSAIALPFLRRCASVRVKAYDASSLAGKSPT